MNIGEQPWPDPFGAAGRVRQMQRKLHHWAVSEPDRRFDNVFNLVAHPDFLTVAWERVRGNKGARTAGVDRVSPTSIAEGEEVVEFLGQTREQLRSRTFAPLPVRERLIPKPKSSKLRRLGIPTARDRVVQASLVLVLEPIFEADFKPLSYGFRPKRRAQDAIAPTSPCRCWTSTSPASGMPTGHPSGETRTANVAGPPFGSSVTRTTS